MADINDYAGNAALGYGQNTGGGLLGFQDNKKTTDAMDRFAMYSFYEKRDRWNRANKEKDDMADKMAANLSFTFGDMIDSDKQKVLDRVQEFYKLYQDNPNAASLKQNPDGTTNAEAYSKFVGQRNQIIQDIVMANRRKAQEIAIDADIAKITSPKKQADAREWKRLQMESKTNLSDNLELFPDIAIVDVNKAVSGALKESVIKYDDLQQGPNKDIKTTFQLVDMQNAMGNLQRQMAFTEGFRDQIVSAKTQWNQIIEESKVDGKLDVEKLRKHPSGMGQSIIDQVDKANRYMDYYNSEDVQKVVKTGKQQKINLDDSMDDDEMLRMMVGTNGTTDSTIQVIETDDALQKGQQAIGWANVANDREKMKQDAEQFRQTKGAAVAGGDAGNLGWFNLAKQAQTADENGVLVNSQGYENAFARDTGATQETTEEELDEEGNPTGNTIKVKSNVRQAPRSLVVKPSKDGNPNNFKVIATYDVTDREAGKGGQKFTTKEFTGAQAYDAMSFLSGNARDVKAISEMNTKYRLREIGSRQPDYETYRKYYEGDQPAPAATGTTTERTKTSTTTNTGKGYTFRGKTWTEAQVRKVYDKKKKQGETFEQFLQRLNSGK